MNREQTIQDILEVVTFLKDNMASKDDLANLESRMATKDDLANLESRMATKDDLANFVTKDDLDNKLFEVKNEIMNHIDGFIGLHHKLDIEFTSLRATVQRMEEEIQAMKKQMQMN